MEAFSKTIDRQAAFEANGGTIYNINPNFDLEAVSTAMIEGREYAIKDDKTGEEHKTIITDLRTVTLPELHMLIMKKNEARFKAKLEPFEKEDFLIDASNCFFVNGLVTPNYDFVEKENQARYRFIYLPTWQSVSDWVSGMMPSFVLKVPYQAVDDELSKMIAGEQIFKIVFTRYQYMNIKSLDKFMTNFDGCVYKNTEHLSTVKGDFGPMASEDIRYLPAFEEFASIHMKPLRKYVMNIKTIWHFMDDDHKQAVFDEYLEAFRSCFAKCIEDEESTNILLEQRDLEQSEPAVKM